ncbi:MAG TPA: PilZ domain-containing protein [Blastocatellia bacterium]|nr:PilZ domain-containing protein [Blastocatellia bacterium]
MIQDAPAGSNQDYTEAAPVRLEMERTGFSVLTDDLPVKSFQPARRDDHLLMREKRRYKRLPLAQEVECEVNGRAFAFRSTDISAEGMFIETLGSVPSGTVITVKFRLPQCEEAITATAQVCYVQERIGFGVRFLDLPLEHVERIRALAEMPATQRVGNPLGNDVAMRVRIPIQLKGEGSLGGAFTEQATIVKVSKNGVCVHTKADLAAGVTIFIYAPYGKRFTGRVLWAGNRGTRTAGQVIIRSRGLAQALGFYFP